ncbi:MAG: DUF4149 domain-containing protein [Acidipila sp.]|nr:DUF4149 domain-containing protein [Acidipila sp.]
MTTLLYFLEMLALSVWVGGIVFLSFILAPSAFVLLPANEAGALVGLTLTRLHLAGYVATLVFLGSRVARAGVAAQSESFSRSELLLRPAMVCVLLMFLLTAISQQVVRPRMEVARAEKTANVGTLNPSPQSSAPGVPASAAFDRLHRISVKLEGGVLLLGLAAFFFTAREYSHPIR